MLFDDYVNTLLPGNYALTKSMEIVKAKTSGTLWYMKKFLVLYYYIFLSDEIETDQYISKVVNTFDSYIDSMPDVQRNAAKDFFYPSGNKYINFKSNDFVKFSSFASYTVFVDLDEKKKYNASSRKCYFMLLMDVGGQTGVKKEFKKRIALPGFVYSPEGVKKVLFDSAIDICFEQINLFGMVRDNSIKYIFPKNVMEKIQLLSSGCTYEEIRKIATSEEINPKYKNIENDAVAFIRNERQILFYYGYCHSKSAGASEMEFSSLSPVGEMGIIANEFEFAALWEHQKLKMISQPALADINDLPDSVDGKLFEISYTPYLNVLKFLQNKGELSYEQYKYYVSRKKNSFQNHYDEIEEEILSRLDEVKTYVANFGRRRDIEDEDGLKELAKYMQGIRDDIENDFNSNVLGLCKKVQSGYKVTDFKKLSIIISIYSRINRYKIYVGDDIFEEAEKDLRRRYIETQLGQQNSTDPKVKIKWDLYNIGIDQLIYVGVTIAMACSHLNLSFDMLVNETERTKLKEYIGQHFVKAFYELGARTEKKRNQMIELAVSSMMKDDYSSYTEENKSRSESINKYKESSTADLFVKIQDISLQADVSMNIERKRNTSLIGILKAYNMKMYSTPDNMLKCECCGKETFVTEKEEPYIEFHHIIPFKEAYGPDHYLNLYALCPMCHRKIHYIKQEEKKALYKDIDLNNFLKKSLVERLISLKQNKFLKSYHLEFLLVEEALTQEEYDKIAI